MKDPQVKFDEFLKLLGDPQMAQEMQKLYIPSTLIERTGKQLGKGQFGVASIAVYNNKEVCIKTCQIDVQVIII